MNIMVFTLIITIISRWVSEHDWIFCFSVYECIPGFPGTHFKLALKLKTFVRQFVYEFEFEYQLTSSST